MKPAVDRALGGFVAALMALAVLNVTWQVVSRFLLADPSSFTDELSRFLLIWIGLFGGAHGVGARSHLSMNLFVERMRSDRRALLASLVDALILGFALVVMIVGGGRLAWLSFELGQRSAALDLPLGFVYLAVPAAGVLIAFYAVVFILERHAHGAET